MALYVTRGKGVQKSEDFADVICGWSPTAQSSPDVIADAAFDLWQRVASNRLNGTPESPFSWQYSKKEETRKDEAESRGIKTTPTSTSNRRVNNLDGGKVHSF